MLGRRRHASVRGGLVGQTARAFARPLISIACSGIGALRSSLLLTYERGNRCQWQCQLRTWRAARQTFRIRAPGKERMEGRRVECESASLLPTWLMPEKATGDFERSVRGLFAHKHHAGAIGSVKIAIACRICRALRQAERERCLGSVKSAHRTLFRAAAHMLTGVCMCVCCCCCV